VIKQAAIIEGYQLLPTTYNIVPNILVSRLTPYINKHHWGSSMWISM